MATLIILILIIMRNLVLIRFQLVRKGKLIIIVLLVKNNLTSKSFSREATWNTAKLVNYSLLLRLLVTNVNIYQSYCPHLVNIETVGKVLTLKGSWGKG